jgi:hypothetical protein
MVRGKKPLRSRVRKMSVRWLGVSPVHTPPFASWACSARYLARGGRRGRAPAVAHVNLPGMGQGRFMGGGGYKYPGY